MSEPTGSLTLIGGKSRRLRVLPPPPLPPLPPPPPPPPSDHYFGVTPEIMITHVATDLVESVPVNNWKAFCAMFPFGSQMPTEYCVYYTFLWNKHSDAAKHYIPIQEARAYYLCAPSHSICAGQYRAKSEDAQRTCLQDMVESHKRLPHAGPFGCIQGILAKVIDIDDVKVAVAEMVKFTKESST